MQDDNADKEAITEMELDSRRLPRYAVKNDYKNNRFYPEIMTQFGQFEAGSPCSDYGEAVALGKRLANEGKEVMAEALKQWIAKKKLKKAKP
jgi:hypothetical protein